MIRTVLAVQDKAAEVFAAPFTVTGVGAGLRSFIDEVNRPGENNPMYSHPEHFVLWKLGTYDDNNGNLVSDRSILAHAMDVSEKNGKEPGHG